MPAVPAPWVKVWILAPLLIDKFADFTSISPLLPVALGATWLTIQALKGKAATVPPNDNDSAALMVILPLLASPLVRETICDPSKAIFLPVTVI